MLTAYYADHLIAADAAACARSPARLPDQFAEEVSPSWPNRRDTGIPSHIVALSFGRSGKQEDGFALVQRMQRSRWT